MKIKTSKFIFSKQAKKLPKTIEIDNDFAYILGLWKADRCSTAKGIVGIRSKDDVLIDKYKSFIQKLGLEIKERTVKGFGITKEVYVCSMPLRRIFECISKKRLKLGKELIPAYIAGLIDGDGTIVNDKNKKIIRIFYEKKDKEDVEIDKILLEKIGIKSKITDSKTRNLIILTIRSMQSISKLILPFILLNKKIQKLKVL